MKIIVSGPATAVTTRTGEKIVDPVVLRSLHGLSYDADVVANHLDHPSLIETSIVGGAIAIAYDEQQNRLRVVSEFWAPAELNKEQLEAVIDETRGQWSDGIGEGCFDEWEDTNGIHLDLSPYDRREKVIVQQVEDGRPVPAVAHLARAVWNGKVDVIKQAVAEKADLDVSRYDGFTALRLAILRNNVELALMLIEGGADVNLQHPLIASISMRQPADALTVARALIARGADVNAVDADGQTTALQAARRRQQQDLVDLLVASGARG